MGTEISLSVCGMDITWSKNSRGHDHGHLYQECDRKRVHCETIDYDYWNAQDDDEEVAAYEASLTKSLGLVMRRIELLGCTIDAAKEEYEHVSAACKYERENQDCEILKRPHDFMSFDEFCSFLSSVKLSELDDEYISYDSAEKDSKIMGRFTDDAIKDRIPCYEGRAENAYSEKTYFEGLINFMHPYVILRLLAINPLNHAVDVTWQYGPLVNNGWAKEEEFTTLARRRETFLIATEGSSDVHILQHAFNLLRPEVADFFKFIDVSRRHPFSGAGNLVRFAEGLEKIDVHNQVLFVLDNDVEGLIAFETITASNLPDNMQAMVLPSLPDFEAFPTKGPHGSHTANINGRAAAIECYLDLAQSNLPGAEVIWTSYKKNKQVYQGELLDKVLFTKAFLRQTKDTIAAGNYDVSKLEVLLDSIIAQCCEMARKAEALT